MQASLDVRRIWSCRKLPVDWRWYLFATLWLLAIMVGFGLVVDFETKPSASADWDPTWPAGSHLALAGDATTIVMFLHPACPCSSASLEELNELLADKRVPAKTYLVIVGPTEAEEIGSNQSRAATIPNTVLWLDESGKEARRFGSRTSGDVFVFDATGRLRFQGGITAARGHVGPNEASAAALAAIDGCNTAECHMPVFGCPLF
jgi:hypothetical protein